MRTRDSDAFADDLADALSEDKLPALSLVHTGHATEPVRAPADDARATGAHARLGRRRAYTGLGRVTSAAQSLARPPR